MVPRRRVDWPMILQAGAPVPAIVDSATPASLAALLSACDDLLALEDVDSMLRHAVELALNNVGLRRAGIFLFDEPRNLMLGTWGTDLDGHVVDEHHVMYEVGGNDREVFRRANEGVPFTVLENCPIVVQRAAETSIVGRGWVACTPIRSARASLGMMFNDAGVSGEPVDPLKQAQAAILCCLLGTLLDLTYGAGGSRKRQGAAPTHPLVRQTVRHLAKDPSLTGKALAERLEISLSRLARVFKLEMGMSLVEYRNRLRLERFQVLVDRGGENLLAAALTAGFGSYAQFHRVFRAIKGSTPRAHLRERGHWTRRRAKSS